MLCVQSQPNRLWIFGVAGEKTDSGQPQNWELCKLSTIFCLPKVNEVKRHARLCRIQKIKPTIIKNHFYRNWYLHEVGKQENGRLSWMCSKNNVLYSRKAKPYV